jgi:hypothetical protein
MTIEKKKKNRQTNGSEVRTTVSQKTSKKKNFKSLVGIFASDKLIVDEIIFRKRTSM